MSSLAAQDDWNRHWNDYAGAAESNPAQRFRRRLILSELSLRSRGSTARVLDIGSGQGDFAADLVAHDSSAELLGLELSASGVEIASRKVPQARFLQCDLLEPHQPPLDWRAWATHAVCSEVLEHLDDPERLLHHAKAWMAPGCRLIVTVPGGPMSAFDRYIGHRRHYRPQELRHLLQRAGFHVESATGAGFPFFNLYRTAVIARGSRLIGDVSGRPSGSARLAMSAFEVLFRLNRRNRGWQNIAVATLPDR